MIKTFSYRVKDSTTAKHLDAHAQAVNAVWNFCNDTQRFAIKWDKKWPTSYDLQKLTTGTSKALGLHSQTIQQICEEYATRRKQHQRRWLRYRGKRSLGWVPFKASGLKRDGNDFCYQSRRYRAWIDRPIEGKILCGSFSQDARCRWYINVTCEVADAPASDGKGSVGIDLGLRTMATLSTGRKVEAKRFYRDLQPALGLAQRARKQRQIAKIHRKIANRRKDFLHKESTRLVQENAAIFVGDVNSQGLAKTQMAKSVLDAGWSMFKTYLSYKANAPHRRTGGVWFSEVNEAYTTQACSSCGVIAASSPKGRTGLGISEWRCECGVTHDRDINAAINIHALGHQSLAGGNLAR